MSKVLKLYNIKLSGAFKGPHFNTMVVAENVQQGIDHVQSVLDSEKIGFKSDTIFDSASCVATEKPKDREHPYRLFITGKPEPEAQRKLEDENKKLRKRIIDLRSHLRRLNKASECKSRMIELRNRDVDWFRDKYTKAVSELARVKHLPSAHELHEDWKKERVKQKAGIILDCLKDLLENPDSPDTKKECENLIKILEK